MKRGGENDAYFDKFTINVQLDLKLVGTDHSPYLPKRFFKMELELRVLARIVWKYQKLWEMGILGIYCKRKISSSQVSKKDLEIHRRISLSLTTTVLFTK